LERNWEGTLTPESGAKSFAGGEDFQRFIAQELIPFIDQRYGTLPGKRSYFGHSLGAGFGLFTLLTQPELFQNYLCSSPTLTYHGITPEGTRHEHNDFTSQRVISFVEGGRRLNEARLYISMGAEEQFEGPLANWRFVSSFYEFLACLKSRPIPGLSVMSEVFSGETHNSVWPIAFSRGVRTIFGCTSQPHSTSESTEE